MKVILATDGSQYAEEAAWLLAHLPHVEHLELTVLFVSNIPNLYGSTAELTKRMQAEDTEKAAALFVHLREIFDGADTALELVFAHGHIGKTIVNEAHARKSDLIVLGAIGHSMLDRLFGSTSDFVATHASCSVLVVRPTGLNNAKRPIDVCFAYDTSNSSSAVFEQLSQFGWGENSKIDVANVVSIPFIYSEIPYELDIDGIKTATLRELESAAIRLRKYSPHVKTHVLEANHVGDRLVQFAKEKGSDIIIMGNTGSGLINTFLLGSTSKYVLRHAACSVWIARKKPE
jgi:nucleotide-binding universal stress UspA family protein